MDAEGLKQQLFKTMRLDQNLAQQGPLVISFAGIMG
jgi:hypothetical protein